MNYAIPLFNKMTYSEIHQENFELVLKNRPFDWLLSADRFFIGQSKIHKTDIGGREIFIESRAQISGAELWVVRMDSWVLSRSGEYLYEPSPSNRSNEFINETRYSTKEMALGALLIYERQNEHSVKILKNQKKWTRYIDEYPTTLKKIQARHINTPDIIGQEHYFDIDSDNTKRASLNSFEWSYVEE